MKMLCVLFSLGFAVVTASATGIETRRAEETGKKYQVYETASGQVYRDVTITKITDAGITITHADGSARLRFENLNLEQRKEFGITQEAAEAIYAKEMKARAAYEAQVAAKHEERKKAHEELLSKHRAALSEAKPLEAQRVEKQQEQQQVATNIASTLEVPAFPIIRGYNNEILYPILSDSRPQRKISYRSGGHVYSGSRGAYDCYPSYGGYYHRGYHHRYSSSMPRCGSIFNFTFR